MTQEEIRAAHAAHVRRYYDVVDADDVAGVLDIFTDDATYCRPGYEPMVGREALREFYEGERVIETGRHTVLSLLVDTSRATGDADEAFVRGSFEGRLKNGQTATLQFADFFRFAADGRVSYRHTYFYAPLV